MNRCVRSIVFLTLAFSPVASFAFAQPDPNMSRVGVGLTGNPAMSIRLTGRNTASAGSPALPTGTVLGFYTLASPYTVEIVNFANQPIQGSTVVFDFSACLPAAGGDIEISCDQSLAPGQSYMAPGRVVGNTDASGRFTFNFQGSAASALLPGSDVVTTGINCQSVTQCINAGCVRVYADGVLLAGTPLRVTAWDQNASSMGGRAVSGADAAIIAAEVARKTIVGFQKQRSDVNQNGNLEGGDAATVGAAAVLPMPGSYPVATGPYCP
jgi:hypothetical protein